MIGERLEDVRREFEISQKEMSRILGIHQNIYGRYKSGSSKLTPEMLVALSNQNINLKWLLTGEGSMFLDEKDSPVSVQNNITKSKNSSINNNFGNDKPMTLAERHKANMDSDALSIYEMTQKFSGGKFDTNEFLEIFNKISEQAKETIRHKDELLRSKDEIIKSKDEYIELLKTQIEKGK